MYGLYSRAASNQERPMMARVRYNTLGRWVDRLNDQESDGPSIVLID